MAQRIVTRSELRRGISLPTDEPNTIALRSEAIRLRLIGLHFETNKNFLLPDAMPGIRALVQVYQEHPNAELLVVGHTDRSGEPAYNDELSLERADSVAAYLADDVDSWLARYESSVPSQKRWGSREDNLMLQSLPDAESKPPGQSFVRWFQETRGLAVDGIAGPQTRGKLVAEYMAHDATTLPEGTSVTGHGCGENFPLDNAGQVDSSLPDGKSDAQDRRVEVFVFLPPGIRPPPVGRSSPPNDPNYLTWLRAVTETRDFGAERPEVGTSQITYLLRTNAGKLPVANEPYRLNVRGRTLEGVTNEEGLIAHFDLPAGDYRIELERGSTIVGTLRAGTDPIPHEVHGLFLEMG